jgi:hypothetical protein
MAMNRPVSTLMHGVLDYVGAGMLYAVPRIFGWSDRVTNLMSASAVGTLGLSLFTRYECGLVGAVSMRTHLMVDAINGATLCAAPLLLREKDRSLGVVPMFLTMGLTELAASMLTQETPRSTPAIGRRRMALKEQAPSQYRAQPQARPRSAVPAASVSDVISSGSRNTGADFPSSLNVSESPKRVDDTPIAAPVGVSVNDDINNVVDDFAGGRRVGGDAIKGMH